MSTTKREKMQPDKTGIRAHLEFLFKDTPTEYSDGRIEIAYTGANTKALAQANYFGLDELDTAAEFVVQKNTVEGINVYVGAALRKPDCPPFGRSNITDYYAATCVWADIDDAAASAAAKDAYASLPPHMVVVTGRNPHRRFQAWWRLNEIQNNPASLKEALAGIKRALAGDPAVVDPSRVMRVGGTVAWPKKEGRVTELTETHRVNDNICVIDQIKASFPPPLIMDAHTGEIRIDDGKPRNPFTGNLEVRQLLEATRTPHQWNANMLIAIGSMVGRGWTDEQIRISCAPYSIGADNDHDIIEMLNRTRIKFGKSAADIGIPISEQKQQLKARSQLYYIAGRDIKFNTDDTSLIKDVIGKSELSVIYGESNCGKTFFMTDLAFHVARGLQWRGKRVSQGGVMYAALEGAKGLSGRYEAYCVKNNIERSLPFGLMPCALDFYSEAANITEFIDLIKAAQDDIGDPALVVVDTLSRALAGGDENSGQDMGRLVYYADMIRRDTRAHLSFVHHSGKNKALGARGHSSLRAAVDTEIEISREEDDDYSVIKFVKQREMEMIEDLAFSLERVVLGVNGFNEEVTSCVVTPAEITGERKERPATPKERFVYEAIVATMSRYSRARQPYKDGPTLQTITFDQFAEVLQEMGYGKMFTNDGEQTALAATQSVRIALRDKNMIGFTNNIIWMLQ